MTSVACDHDQGAVDLRRLPIVRPAGNPRHRKIFVIVADVAAVVVAMLMAYLLSTIFRGLDSSTRPGNQLLFGALSLPVWIAMCVHYGLYNSRHVASRLDEFGSIVHSSMGTVLVIVVTSFAFHREVSRSWLILTLVMSVVVLTAEREVVRRVFWSSRQRGRLLRPVIIVGCNSEAIALCSLLDDSIRLGYRVVGFVDNGVPVGSYPWKKVPVLGTIGETLELARAIDASGVVIATTAVSDADSNRLARQLVNEGIFVELTSSLCDIAPERLSVKPLGRRPVVFIEPARRNGWRGLGKRLLDLALSFVTAVVAAPVVALAALAIKLDSPGPVFFRQQRVGRDGRSFEVWKLRTMVAEAEEMIGQLLERNEADGPLFKLRDDPRVSRVGRILRRYSIDELPQLWNVFRNEMSLVGPRPALPSEVQRWDPELHNRLRVKPGLTGMWQVNGRSDCSFNEYMRLDLYYVDNWSLWSDLAILVRTLPTVFAKRGAY